MTDQDYGSAVVVTQSERNTRWFFRNMVDVIAGAEQTGGAYAMFELIGPPGDEVPLHVHTEEDEAFLLLEGEMTVWVGDDVRTLRAGDYALMPKHVVHCYKVTSDTAARWIAITSPAGFEDYVIEISEPAAERRLPDFAGFDPEKMAEAGKISEKYGVTFRGAPGQRPSDLKK
ncbi:cupin domain-containing protein [Nocardia sp. R6R-6]|uniref:cupin domain-containing protein n=1 Tax=Nocardia sp. R6R-6 TaxID=3459303 RepID=UPI00403D9E39